MKANELSYKDVMVGDWVDVRNDAAPNTPHLERITPSHFFRDEYWYGVELVPEILEKNGFVANKHVYPYPYYEYINEKDKLKVGFAFPQGNRTSYKDPWVYVDSENVFIEHLPCIFVHQFQHALRLCGIDKTIEL
jgi:hypothetical protein